MKRNEAWLGGHVGLGRALATSVLFCVAATPASALDPAKSIKDYAHRIWHTEQGVPHPLVNSVFQSRNGYMWLSTTGGLVRFDGVRFTLFNELNVPQMRDANVRLVTEDREGALWFCTFGGDVVRMKDGEFASMTPKDGVVLEAPLSIFADRDGGVWVGASRGVGRFKDGKWVPFPGRDGQPVTGATQVIQDGQGTIWVASLRDVYRVAEERLVPVLALGRDGVTRPFATLVAPREGGLWVGTEGGLFRYRADELTAVPLKGAPSDHCVSMIEDRNRDLWIGTMTGLYRLRDGRLEAYTGEEALSGEKVQGIVEDRDGNLWLATNCGIDQFFDAAFTMISTGLSIPKVYSLVEDRDGVVWGATEGGPVSWRGDRFVPVVGNGLTPMSLWRGMHVDVMGKLWQSGNFLQVLSGGRWSRVPAPEGNTLGVCTDRRGDLWIAHTVVDETHGLAHRVSGQWTTYTTRDGLPPSMTQSLYCDRRGGVWQGTSKGLVHVEQDHVSTLTTRDGLPNDFVRPVYEDNDGVIWIGTRRGLARIRDGRVAAFTKQQGMPDDVLTQIAEDGEGNLWISSSAYVFRVRKSDLEDQAAGKIEAVTVSLYGRLDGLRGMGWGVTQPAALRRRDGSLWLATDRGVAVIRAENMRRRTTPPTVFIERLVADGRTIRLGPEVTVPPGYGNLELQFTALGFKAPERMRFRYKLENYDRDWNEAGRRREAFYTRLAPGPYVFRVHACDSDGVCTETPKELSFVIKPHWYQRLFFKILVGLAVPLIVAAAYRRRVAALHRQQQKLQEAVEERTRDLRQAEQAAGRERDLLHALMDNIPDLIYFKDTESRYTRVNHAHAQALGLSAAEQAIGKTDFDFYDAEFAEASRSDERNLVAEGVALVGKVDHEARSGRYYLATKVPIREGGGQITGLVGISKDITDRRRAEEKLERDLSAFLEVVNSVAQGDLTLRGAEGDDTLGRIARSMNRMIESFTTILSELREAAFSLASSSAEILAASTQIAKGAQYGRDEIVNTTAAVEEMAASMRQVSNNAAQSAAAAQRVLDHVRESDRSVNATDLGMTKIDAWVKATAEKMHVLGERSQEISEIVAMIEEIASQSKLLSLNAAIEAAHAGEAGRGFTVVAEEMRRLADLSTQATKNITAIIVGVAKETQAALEAMENGLKEVHTGRDLSEQARKSLEEIQILVRESAHLSEQISEASREQATATQTVSQSMQAITRITEESTAGTNETAKAVQDLVLLSERLTEAISRFKIDRATRRSKLPERAGADSSMAGVTR